MKNHATIFGLVTVLFIAGCASRPRDYLRAEDVPKTTPWHTNDVAYSVYQLGYLCGYDDFMASHAARKERLPVDPTEAERDGYLAGVEAAYSAWDKHWQEYWRTNWIPYSQKGVPPQPIRPVK